jgi:hypothetical protein
MRNGIKILESLTNDKSENKAIKEPKGRNSKLAKNRDECIMYRYYYYAKIQRLRYDDVHKILSKEFFYAERTISNVIIKNHDQLKNIFNDKPSINKLKEKYPFLTWKN